MKSVLGKAVETISPRSVNGLVKVSLGAFCQLAEGPPIAPISRLIICVAHYRGHQVSLISGPVRTTNFTPGPTARHISGNIALNVFAHQSRQPITTAT